MAAKRWIEDYLSAHKRALDSIPVERVERLLDELRAALRQDRRIFVFGNGGSAANAAHFVTDLGKGAADAVSGAAGKRFRCLSLNDNVSWMTAIGNDYAYEDIFWRQLQNHGRPGDLVIALSVSGSSPNVVKAMGWAREHGMKTVALVGGKRGAVADIAEEVIAIDDVHYGRVEDAQMTICHMLCYAFMEGAALP
jgi:D-sedoheptulose 7-phosphate isomerase